MTSKSALNIIKEPHQRSEYSKEGLTDLLQCIEDPMYFMKNFMKIQHPLKGAVAFEPYPFQEKLIRGFHEHRFSIALTARQLGKCCTNYTIISQDGCKVKIGSLIELSWKEWIVEKLETLLLKIAII